MAQLAGLSRTLRSHAKARAREGRQDALFEFIEVHYKRRRCTKHWVTGAQKSMRSLGGEKALRRSERSENLYTETT